MVFVLYTFFAPKDSHSLKIQLTNVRGLTIFLTLNAPSPLTYSTHSSHYSTQSTHSSHYSTPSTHSSHYSTQSTHSSHTPHNLPTPYTTHYFTQVDPTQTDCEWTSSGYSSSFTQDEPPETLKLNTCITWQDRKESGPSLALGSHDNSLSDREEDPSEDAIQERIRGHVKFCSSGKC